MINVTLFSTDEGCMDLCQVKCTHITMFEKDSLAIQFIDEEEQMKLIKVLVKKYVKFIGQGNTIRIQPSEFLRVRYRFDSIT